MIRKQIVQFVVMFLLLSKSRVMIDFEGLKELFVVLKVKHTPKKIRLILQVEVLLNQ